MQTLEKSPIKIRGWVLAEVFDANGKLKQSVKTHNLIVNAGDAVLASIIAGGAAVLHGMNLGSGTTSPAKSQTALTTQISNTYKGEDATYPQAINDGSGTNRRVRSIVTWNPGEATANGIAEVAMWTAGTGGADPSGTMISRALLSPTINKGANDTLQITWDFDVTGA